MRRQLILVLTVAVLGLVAASAYARAAGQGGAADSSSGKELVAPLPKSEAPDTSMFNGSGLNSLSVPIDRPVSGGVMRKDPGTRTWYFIKGMTDAEAKAAYEKFRREIIVSMYPSREHRPARLRFGSSTGSCRSSGRRASFSGVKAVSVQTLPERSRSSPTRLLRRRACVSPPGSRFHALCRISTSRPRSSPLRSTARTSRPAMGSFQAPTGE